MKVERDAPALVALGNVELQMRIVWIAVFDMPWTVDKSTCIYSHASGFVIMKAAVCSFSMKMVVTPTVPAGSRSRVLHTHIALVSHVDATHRKYGSY